MVSRLFSIPLLLLMLGAVILGTSVCGDSSENIAPTAQQPYIDATLEARIELAVASTVEARSVSLFPTSTPTPVTFQLSHEQWSNKEYLTSYKGEIRLLSGPEGFINPTVRLTLTDEDSNFILSRETEVRGLTTGGVSTPFVFDFPQANYGEPFLLEPYQKPGNYWVSVNGKNCFSGLCSDY